MLRFFVPGPVEKMILTIARETPPLWNWLSFSAGIAGFCLVAAFVLHRVLLSFDAEFAVRARLKGQQPSAVIHATGHIAVWLPRAFGVIAAVVIGVEILLMLHQIGITLPSDAVSALRRFAIQGWR